MRLPKPLSMSAGLKFSFAWSLSRGVLACSRTPWSHTALSAPRLSHGKRSAKDSRGPPAKNPNAQHACVVALAMRCRFLFLDHVLILSPLADGDVFVCAWLIHARDACADRGYPMPLPSKRSKAQEKMASRQDTSRQPEPGQPYIFWTRSSRSRGTILAVLMMSNARSAICCRCSQRRLPGQHSVCPCLMLARC